MLSRQDRSSFHTSRTGGRLNKTGGNALMSQAGIGAEGSEVLSLATECSNISLNFSRDG